MKLRAGNQPAVLAGCHPEPRFEDAGQMALIGEAANRSGLDQRLSSSQQLPRKVDAAVDEPRMRGETGRLAEHADEVPRAQANMRGERGKVDRSAQMSEKIGLRLPYRRLLAGVDDVTQASAVTRDSR